MKVKSWLVLTSVLVLFALLLSGCSSIDPAKQQQLQLNVDPILLEPVPEMIEIQTTNRCSLIPTTELMHKDQ